MLTLARKGVRLTANMMLRTGSKRNGFVMDPEPAICPVGQCRSTYFQSKPSDFGLTADLSGSPPPAPSGPPQGGIDVYFVQLATVSRRVLLQPCTGKSVQFIQ